MPKFHLITEKLSKKIRLKILSKNTAAFSTRISKISRENNVKRCTLSRFFAFLINAAVLYPVRFSHTISFHLSPLKHNNCNHIFNIFRSDSKEVTTKVLNFLYIQKSFLYKTSIHECLLTLLIMFTLDVLQK